MPRKCPCGKHAYFNVLGEKPICCSKCKTNGMIDVKNKRCPCGKHPIFNIPGGKPICCSKCKTDEMIDVVSKRCSCGKQPVFNVPGKTIGVCCMKCKTNDMIDVVNKRCPCGTIPVFNVSGAKIGVCCSKCKTEDMIDIVNKRCSCGTKPVFNVPGETVGICCQKCKTDNMIDVVTKKCPCGKKTYFNVQEETKGVCCSKCKTDDMINVVSKVCPGYDRPCPVRTYVSNGHMYCISCDPDDARRKRHKMHEEAFFAYVKDKLNVHRREFHVKLDPDETSKKFARLDGIVFGSGVIVCLEVDENGHQDYECDEHRMHLVTAELLLEYPNHMVSWVRVNPTTDKKDQWDKPSRNIREKRFKEVVDTTRDILKTCDTRVVYIGF